MSSTQGKDFTAYNAKAVAPGLADEQLDEVAFFHAERCTDQSNFKVTLRDFVKKRSLCSEVCGGGIETSTPNTARGPSAWRDHVVTLLATDR